MRSAGNMCTVYTYDRENNILFTLDAAGGEHRIPVNDKTIAGSVCVSARPERIDNVYEDSRFKQSTAALNPRRSFLPAHLVIAVTAVTACDNLQTV